MSNPRTCQNQACDAVMPSWTKRLYCSDRCRTTAYRNKPRRPFPKRKYRIIKGQRFSLDGEPLPCPSGRRGCAPKPIPDGASDVARGILKRRGYVESREVCR